MVQIDTVCAAELRGKSLKHLFLHGLLGYTATAGMLVFLFQSLPWAGMVFGIPWRSAASIARFDGLILALIFTVVSLTICECILRFPKPILVKNLWLVLLGLTWMGFSFFALFFFPHERDETADIVYFNSFLVFSVYLVRFQRRLSEMGFFYAWLMGLNLFWPSISIWMDAANDDRYGILDWKADQITSAVSFFVIPLFLILPGLLARKWTQRASFFCGLFICLLIAMMLNHNLVYFIMTGHIPHLYQDYSILFLIPFALGWYGFFALYVLLLSGFAKMGGWMWSRILRRFPLDAMRT